MADAHAPATKKDYVGERSSPYRASIFTTK